MREAACGSGAAANASTATAQPCSERLVVQLITYKGAWISRLVGSSDDGEVFYVRQSSMRNKSEWSKLHQGSLVSFSIKRMAGRGIVSDAVLEKPGSL